MSETGQSMITILMLIGGSPGSTAGGMKTTTIAVLLANVIAVFRRTENPHFFKRRISAETVSRASTILIMYLVLFLTGGFILSRLEGILLLIGMTAYLISMVISALKNRQDEENGKVLSLPKSLLYIAGGLIAVIAGGNLVVDNACIIAESFGVSQNFIGLTIIAVGTSLPELVTSIVATRKGDSGLALGNAIGSNIFNILFILGISATITPLAVLSESVIDCILLLLSAILLYIFARSKKSMCRWEGAVCILLYIAYTGYLLVR